MADRLPELVMSAMRAAEPEPNPMQAYNLSSVPTRSNPLMMIMKKNASTLALLLCAAVIATANANTEMEQADTDIGSLHLPQMEQAQDAIIPEPSNELVESNFQPAEAGTGKKDKEKELTAATTSLMTVGYNSQCLKDGGGKNFFLRGPNGKWCRMSAGNGSPLVCDKTSTESLQTFQSHKGSSGGWTRDKIMVQPRGVPYMLSDRGASHRVECHYGANGGWEMFEAYDAGRRKVPSPRYANPNYGHFIWEYDIVFKGGREGQKCRLDGVTMRCNGGTSSRGWTDPQYRFTVVYRIDYMGYEVTNYCPNVRRECALSSSCTRGAGSTISWYSGRGHSCRTSWAHGVNGNAGSNSHHKRCPDWAGTGTGAWDNEHYRACRNEIKASYNLCTP